MSISIIIESEYSRDIFVTIKTWKKYRKSCQSHKFIFVFGKQYVEKELHIGKIQGNCIMTNDNYYRPQTARKVPSKVNK